MNFIKKYFSIIVRIYFRPFWFLQKCSRIPKWLKICQGPEFDLLFYNFKRKLWSDIIDNSKLKDLFRELSLNGKTYISITGELVIRPCTKSPLGLINSHLGAKIKKERSYNRPLLGWKFKVMSYKEPNQETDLLLRAEFFTSHFKRVKKREVL